MPARRALVVLALGLVLALAGCGWTPLYADRATEPADEELRAIKVDPIPDRIGQRLAWALRESFNPTGVPTPQRYRLSTLLTTARADLGIQSTGLGSRGKFDANATFTLRDIKTGASLLAQLSHVSESFDIVANEYASIVAEDDARTRAVEELRRDIVARLTLFLQQRAAVTGGKP
ncbi:MAG TPA: LPS assembly lipoprotein LptE [Stellaceae bacterium]|nr:LPS assembly lipoprotein LptE [Stellaceae bacterium]